MVVANAFTTASRVRREVRSISAKGYEIHALCWDRQGRHPQRETIDRCQVLNVRFGRTEGLPFSKIYYLLAAVFFQLSILFWVVKWVRNVNSVILHAHDFNTLLGCAASKKLLKNHVRLIYDCHELTPGLYQEWYGTVVAGIVDRLENAALANADAIVSVNEAVHTHLTDKHSVRSILVYNCPARAEIPDLQPIDAKKRLALQGFFVVLFAGWVRQDYDFALILKAARELKKRGVYDVRFVFIGPKETMESLTAAVAEENLEMFFDFRGWVPNHELMLYYLASDLCYAVTSKLGPSTQVLTPIKMFESMACGVPVIVREGTLAAQIVHAWRCGIILAPERNDLFTQLIELKENRGELSALGSGGRRAFRLVFNWDSMAERLLQLYSELQVGIRKE